MSRASSQLPAFTRCLASARAVLASRELVSLVISCCTCSLFGIISSARFSVVMAPSVSPESACSFAWLSSRETAASCFSFTLAISCFELSGFAIEYFDALSAKPRASLRLLRCRAILPRM
jgi:hypothetical protein